MLNYQRVDHFPRFATILGGSSHESDEWFISPIRHKFLHLSYPTELTGVIYDIYIYIIIYICHPFTDFTVRVMSHQVDGLWIIQLLVLSHWTNYGYIFFVRVMSHQGQYSLWIILVIRTILGWVEPVDLRLEPRAWQRGWPPILRFDLFFSMTCCFFFLNWNPKVG